MKRKIIVFLILLFLFFISSYYKSNQILEDRKENVIEESTSPTQKVVLTNNNSIELEEYIIGVVACEMPASFEIEALKAMSVASRTYAKYKMKKTGKLKTTTDDQCYITKEEMKEKWKSTYEKYYNKIKKAVNGTENQYMTYKDEIIIAFYFSISNGYTENVENVFSQKLDYLKTVESPWDKNYSYKEDQKEMSVKSFLNKLNINDEEIKTIKYKRNDSKRVQQLIINDKTIKGTKVRQLLNLKSTDFEINVSDKVVITTKGYGHGVGMSQYGSQAMALKGYKYDEILKYYYKDIDIMNN